MRRFFLYLALSSAACAPTVVATKSMTPAPSPATTPPITFELTPRLSLEWDRYPLRSPAIANGDETLVFTLSFDADMDVASVEAAVRSRLPQSMGFRWEDGRVVRFDVPPGSSDVTIDPRGSRSLARPNVGGVTKTFWDIARPTTTLSLYRPADVAAGTMKPAETRTFPFAADPGLVRIEPGRRGLLVAIVRPQHLSFVDLPSGVRTALPADLDQIGRNGSHMQWLPDGRFLTLGTHETVISGPRGENGRRLATITPGQNGVMSPDESRVALASYPTDEVAIQDIATGTIRSLGTDYRRCSARSSAAPSWSADGTTIAVGYCTDDMKGPGRTAIFDAGTLRRIRTIDGYSVFAFLADGSMLARSWPLVDDYLRLPHPGISVLDARGQIVRRIDSTFPYSLSPDRGWLIDGGLDPEHPTLRVVDTRTGDAYSLGISGSFPAWTDDGLIAILSRG